MIATHYLAEVLMRHPLSAHSPVKLVLPFHVEKCKKGVRVLSIGNLSQEEWGNRDERTQSCLESKKEAWRLNIQGGNAERMYSGIAGAIHSVFSDCFCTKGGADRPKDPFVTFCDYHSSHRDIKKLIKARKNNNKELFLKLVKTIGGGMGGKIFCLK